MVLNAAGDGTYALCDGVIDGTVAGSLLTGTWKQNKFPCGGSTEASGRFQFLQSPDGHTWAGRWSYASAPTKWYTGWLGICRSGTCTKNARPAGSPPARGAAAVASIKRGRFIPAKLSVKSGSAVKLCNLEAAARAPYTLPKTAPNGFRVTLRPGACLTKRLVNTGSRPLTILVFDAHVTALKLTIVVLPR
jgi:hypothetical protein